MPLSPAARVLALFWTKGLQHSQPRVKNCKKRGLSSSPKVLVLHGFLQLYPPECVALDRPRVWMAFGAARFHATGGCAFEGVLWQILALWDDVSWRPPE